MVIKNYCFEAEVIEGQKLGHKLGFPTANFNPDFFPTSIKKGVYSADVTYGEEKYLGVLFFGPKTTFGEVKNVLEVHILDFDENIYEKTIGVCLKSFIRKKKSFPSADLLVSQIKKDILVAKKLSQSFY